MKKFFSLLQDSAAHEIELFFEVYKTQAPLEDERELQPGDAVVARARRPRQAQVRILHEVFESGSVD